MTTIYTITNTETHRTYVGKTSVIPSHRVKKHFEALRSNRHKVKLMQEDFNKYREGSFTVRFLGTFDELEGARMEIFMMHVLRTKDARFGYNYLDRTGTGKNAVADRWRTPPVLWRGGNRKEVNACLKKHEAI